MAATRTVYPVAPANPPACFASINGWGASNYLVGWELYLGGTSIFDTDNRDQRKGWCGARKANLARFAR